MTSSVDNDHVSAPLQGLTANNKGPWLIVCTYIFLISSLLTIGFKILSRFKGTSRLTSNDYFILSAGFFALAEAIDITVAVHFGLGQHRDSLSDSKFSKYEQAIYAANILSILSLAMAKTSITLLVIAINASRKLMYTCYCLLGFVALWTVASIFALAFQCSLPHPWSSEGNHCVDQFALNIGIQALNVFSDVWIVTIPILLMRKVQVTTEKRFIVVGLFSIRLAVPAFTIAMLVYLKRLYRSKPPDPTWDALVPWVFAQIMLNASIITACIPSMKPFLSDIRPGLIVVNVPEHELTNSFVRGSESKSGSRTKTVVKMDTGVSRLAGRLGLGSRRNGSTWHSRSTNSSLWGEKQRQVVANMELGYNRPNASKAKSTVEMDRSESIKGLTDDVILHTIDYKVEYEDAMPDADAITASQGSSYSRRM